MRLISRQDAITAGLVRYFTGEPCKRGHVAPRTVKNATCTKCQVINVKQWQDNNQQKREKWLDESRKRYEQKNPQKVVAAKRAYRQRHSARIKASSAAYYERNKRMFASRKAAWVVAHPSSVSEWERTRKARQLKAMPAWANREAIKRIYAKAGQMTAETGVKHSVDHFYPLQGKIVCGLHVEFNLRVIPLVDNLKKNRSMPWATGTN